MRTYKVVANTTSYSDYEILDTFDSMADACLYRDELEKLCPSVYFNKLAIMACDEYIK